MKKLLITIVFCSFALAAFPQFVSGLGFFAAGNASRHRYSDKNTPETFGSHRGRLILRPGGGIVGDFFPGNVKWRTEFEYSMLGSKETVSVEGSNQKFRNKLDYIDWNNFLKVQLETYSGFPYLMAGARVEYLFRNKPQAYIPVMNSLSQFHFSWDVAAGFEFMAYGPARLFAEYHFFSDIPALYNKDNVKVRGITHELRVGIMFRFQNKGDNCNAPIYNDPY